MQNSSAQTEKEIRRVTGWGLVVNVALSALKFLAGIFASSQALVADAIHSLSDSATDIAVIIGAAFWSSPADDEHPYGHARIETVITFLIGLTLALVGLWLGFRALVTITAPDLRAPGWTAFWVAILSIGVKEWLYRWTVRVGKRIRSTALIANAWHHRSDGFSSVPVAIAILATHLFPGMTYLDHVAAVIVSLFLLKAAWEITAPSFAQLVDAGVSEKERQHISELALSVEKTRGLHALRTRYIGSGILVDCHLFVDPDMTVLESHQIAHEVKRRLLQENANIVDALIHVEPWKRKAPDSTAPEGKDSTS